MEFRLTKHARRRMRRRQVSEDEIRAVLSDPETQYTGLDGNVNLLAQVSGRSLRIVLASDAERPLVITVIVRGGTR